jgi:hypothetical protein
MLDRLHIFLRATGGIFGAVVRPLSLRRFRRPNRPRWETWPPIL